MSKPFDKTYERLNQGPLDTPRLMSGPYWDELRIFLAVAKCKSFNSAANYLQLSQPKVSRSVMHLQDVLGFPLVERSMHGIKLTEKGLSLAGTLIGIDEALFAKADELKAHQREAAGTVRIACTEGLSGVFIIGGLPRFFENYPKINVHLKNPFNITGFRDNAADIVLTYGPDNNAEITSRPAGFLHLVPLVSRSYIERHGMPSLKNLSEHTFVDAGYYQSENATWRPWCEIASKGQARHICDNTINHVRMIKAGLGIGLTANYLLADPELQTADLDIHVRLPLFLHASIERLRARHIRAVYDWLSTIFNDKQVWFPFEPFQGDLPVDQLTPVISQYFDYPPVQEFDSLP